MLGVTVHIASPNGYTLSADVAQRARQLAQHGAKLNLYTDPREAVRGAIAVYTDVWTSMGQEAEARERRQVFVPYRVDRALMAHAAAGARFMHCLPAHHGEEVTSEVFESTASVVFDQAENRLHTQKALLLTLLAPQYV
jgi:ornithine carbamoyltransferase